MDVVTFGETMVLFAPVHNAFMQEQSLGIQVNEEYVRKMAQKGHRWRNPVWRHKDGTIAEW